MYQRLKKHFKLKKFRKAWRMQNSSNRTTVKHIFPIEKVSVGKGTYGDLCVYTWGSKSEKLIIGNYCSIASFVEFILGGNHEYDVATTYPFHVWILGNKNEAKSNGKILIDDDVWIGQSATILSGIHIGQGAIVGARSVVTKSIPPYAIVGGNPAKIIKYRFPQNIIDILMQIDLSQVNSSFFKKNQKLLETKMSIEVANRLLDAFKNESAE